MLNRIREDARDFLIPLSFIFPISALYLFDPNSFELAWKGRTPLLLFLWLMLLELALGWKKLLNRKIGWTWFRTATVVVTVAAPTIYVISAFFLGLSHYVEELGRLVGATLLEHWPISLEYLLFTAFFISSVWLMYQSNGLKRFSVSLFFLGATTFFYMIDTFYPFGTIVALQAFAPLTASSAVHVLNWMGYNAAISRYQLGMPVLQLKGEDVAAIGWPCAGIHSLVIYTFLILLFLKDSPFALRQEAIRAAIPKRLRFMARSKKTDFLLRDKITRAAITATEKSVVNFFRMAPLYIIVGVGAVGTFIVNVLRIVTICIIGLNVGEEAMKLFHSYYGELFFISWVLIYLMMVIYSHEIWTKLSMIGAKMAETGRKTPSKIHP